MVKTCFYAFPGQQNQVSKKLIFYVWGGQKRVFKHLHILPYHQNHVLKKLFVLPLEWLKTCFDAFPHHQNQVIKKLFFDVWSGEKRVLMHFQTTRIKSLKNYFFHLKTCFDAFPSHQNQVLYKLFFSPLEWVITCFYAFPGHQNQVLKKFFFFTSEVVKNVFLCISWPPEPSP